MTPVGTNPSIGLGVGIFDILSPSIPISRCNGSVTFNLRTSTKEELLKLEVSLLLVKKDNQLVEPPIATTEEQVSSHSYSESASSACVTVHCSDLNNNVSLPTVGRVRITVTVVGGSAEISNVNFADGQPCDGKIELNEYH